MCIERQRGKILCFAEMDALVVTVAQLGDIITRSRRSFTRQLELTHIFYTKKPIRKCFNLKTFTKKYSTREILDK